jgi:hypothetical protein
MESAKLYLLNSLTMVITFTNIENTLKIMLLLLSIVYTGVKIYESFNKKVKDETGQ